MVVTKQCLTLTAVVNESTSIGDLGVLHWQTTQSSIFSLRHQVIQRPVQLLIMDRSAGIKGLQAYLSGFRGGSGKNPVWCMNMGAFASHDKASLHALRSVFVKQTLPHTVCYVEEAELPTHTFQQYPWSYKFCTDVPLGHHFVLNPAT